MAVMFVVLLAAGFAVMSWYASGLRQSTDKLLRSDISQISDVVYLNDENKVEIFGFAERPGELPEALRTYRLQIRDMAGEILFSSPGIKERLHVPGNIGQASSPIPGDMLLNNEWVRVVSQRTVLRADKSEKAIIIQTLRSIEPLRDQQARLLNIMLSLFPLPLIAVGMGGWYVARRSMQPLNEIIAAAREMGATNLDARFPVRRDDELGRLAETFNGLFQRLQDAFESMRQFTADASHELRTPLTAIRTKAETTLVRKRKNGEYRECIEDMLEETEQLERMINTLLQLARGDAELVQLKPETFDLTEMTSRWTGHYRPLAEERKQKLITYFPARLPIRADYTLVERIVINLLDNAVEYAPYGTDIVLTISTANGKILFRICNETTALNTGDADKMFDRFYRSGNSSGTNRHSGLGLPIAQWAVRMHRGTISTEPMHGDSLNSGICFNVTLPADRP